MKLILIILLSLACFKLHGQSIALQEYFPLKKGVSHTYYVSQIFKNDTTQSADYTTTCKSLIVKGKEIFYYDDGEYTGDTIIVGAESFCDGVFYYEEGKFMFAPIFWKYEIKQANLNYFISLFPETIAIDTIYHFQDGKEIREYQFTGFEDVQIGNKIYKDCLKLTIVQNWPTSQYIDIVWFQKNTGVVKWLRGTGRLEEIKF